MEYCPAREWVLIFLAVESRRLVPISAESSSIGDKQISDPDACSSTLKQQPLSSSLQTVICKIIRWGSPLFS